MTAYVPGSYSHRRLLACDLRAMLDSAGFSEIDSRGELVFERVHARTPAIRVRVYTTIRNGEVREVGDDAIRVCLVYRNKNGDTRGLSKGKRVNRTGTVGGIVGRTLGRMRDQYGAVPRVDRCSCGAPKFKSKKGNLVCADFCWA